MIPRIPITTTPETPEQPKPPKTRLVTGSIRCACGLLLATLAVGADATPLLETGFDGYRGLGFSPTPADGQLDSSRWKVLGLSAGDGEFGGLFDSGDFARGSSGGGVGTGGIYAFDVSGTGSDPGSDGTDPALGFQATGSDFTPGTIVLRLENDTAGRIDTIDVTLDLYVFNNGGRSTGIDVGLSVGDESSYRGIGDLGFRSPGASDSDPEWVRTSLSATAEGLGWEPGSTLHLRWRADDASGGGARDELAIDNVIINAMAPAIPAALPLPDTGWLTLAAVGGLWLSRMSGRQSRRAGGTPARAPRPIGPRT